jgi:hypothetical protein
MIHSARVAAGVDAAFDRDIGKTPPDEGQRKKAGRYGMTRAIMPPNRNTSNLQQLVCLVA